RPTPARRPPCVSFAAAPPPPSTASCRCPELRRAVAASAGLEAGQDPTGGRIPRRDRPSRSRHQRSGARHRPFLRGPAAFPRGQPPAAMARSVLRGLASCCALAVGGTALALDEQSLIQTVARQELAMPENKLPRSALLTVCFVSKASPGRHSVDQLTNGCILNVASFKLAAPQSDVILIAPTEENAADKIKNLSKKDSSVKISYVGLGPWEVGGQSIPFQNAEGKFYGNGLKLLWYTQTLKKFQGQYDYIFIADGADLYFQRSPVAGKTG
ncbi:unnamed protein product, partial [Prorocentrum cordatum]